MNDALKVRVVSDAISDDWLMVGTEGGADGDFGSKKGGADGDLGGKGGKGNPAQNGGDLIALFGEWGKGDDGCCTNAPQGNAQTKGTGFS